MKLYIKYMVSLRCKKIVMAALDNLGLRYGSVELGEVEVKGEVSDEQHDYLTKELLKSGLELMDDKKSILVEKIKTIIIEMVHYSDNAQIKNNFSGHLTEKMDMDYSFLTNLFSKTTGTTIEQYIIAHKIERAKELILYDELSLTEISYRLNYSSVAHLSNQFKKVTGLTPSFFKQLKQYKRRIALESL